MPPAASPDWVTGTFALATFPSAWQWVLGGLAVLLLASGVDDLIPSLVCFWHWIIHGREPLPNSSATDARIVERTIAIFVPCWDESQVIQEMVRQNIVRIRYHTFHLFLGVYPNDQATCDAVFDAASAFSNVHVCVCPRPGPTSKADCLNAIYEGMKRFEQSHGIIFDTVVLHDAEDVIHPDALRIINRERRQYEMVQIPVLPLQTLPGEFTHGIYCDEFSEFQLIDMRARQYCGAFIPSNGVGTAFSRAVLEHLAIPRGGQVFDQSSLTEDYEIGLQIHQAGFRQTFFPLTEGAGKFIATREYFPRKVRSAIRQRTRWITGIALQCWERHGWRGSWRTRYWFWRDRKGLLTNPLGLVTNVVFVIGATDWLFSLMLHRSWLFAAANPMTVRLCVLTSWLQLFRLALRSLCVSKLFGLKLGATVMLRCFHANFVNCAASMYALRNFALYRWEHKSLRWDKTDHSYPVSAPSAATIDAELSEFGD